MPSKENHFFSFLKSHLPPAPTSTGDFYSQCVPFHSLNTLHPSSGELDVSSYVPSRKRALRPVSLLSSRLATLEMPLWLKCRTSKLPISGSRLPTCPGSLKCNHRTAVGNVWGERASLPPPALIYLLRQHRFSTISTKVHQPQHIKGNYNGGKTSKWWEVPVVCGGFWHGWPNNYLPAKVNSLSCFKIQIIPESSMCGSYLDFYSTSCIWIDKWFVKLSLLPPQGKRFCETAITKKNDFKEIFKK